MVDRWRETPVFFQAAGETLFGILTEPLRPPSGITLVHVRGGSQVPSSGRNGTSARLCRRLAADGHSTFRLDYRGVGESTGTVGTFRHDQPFTSDVEACIAWLQTQGHERFVMVGECFGARTALASAPFVRGLEGLVLLATPVRDAKKEGGETKALVRHRSLSGYALRALDPQVIRALRTRDGRRRYLRAAKAALQAAPSHDSGSVPGWVSDRFLGDFREVVRRELLVVFMNGVADPSFEDFAKARDSEFAGYLRAAGSLITFEEVEGRIAACADADLQDVVIERVATWVRDHIVVVREERSAQTVGP